MKRVVSGMMLTLLLISVLTLAFNIQQIESSEPPVTEWTRTYGGTDNDYAESVVETSDGGYALTGYTLSFGDGDCDFWLVKTNATGNMEWNKTYGGTDNDYVFSVVETSDRGYALAGYTLSLGLGYHAMWLVKVDSLGNVQWNKTYGGTDNHYAFSVQQTSDEGYIVAGYMYSFGAGNRDSRLVKTDAAGNIQWSKTYGGTYDDYVFSVVETSDGGYALAGRTESFGTGEADFWLVKTDAAGNIQWNKTYGGTYDDYGISVVETSDGGYALAGRTESFGTGDYDYWLVKVDSLGNVQWNKTCGGDGSDGARSVVETSDGGYALAGRTESFGAGYTDFWLVKLRTAIHDVAVTNVTPSKDVVGQGYTTSINVTVENQGDYTETFNVTARYNDHVIEEREVTLISTVSTTLIFAWNTTSVPIGDYTISASASPVADEVDTDDNTHVDGVVTVRLPIHDVAVVDVTPSKTVVGQGYPVPIKVTVENQGDCTETFNLTTYANETIIAAFTNITLTSGNCTIITLMWNTTGFAKNYYTISAYANPVLGETGITDNAFTDGQIKVGIPGDVNSDGIVNMVDIYTELILRFMCKTGDPCCSANSDINGDGIINMIDIYTAIIHFMETEP